MQRVDRVRAARKRAIRRTATLHARNSTSEPTRRIRYHLRKGGHERLDSRQGVEYRVVLHQFGANSYPLADLPIPPEYPLSLFVFVICCFVVLFNPFNSFDLNLAISPAIVNSENVYEHLERIASEKLATTGPKMVVQYASEIAKLDGEHAEAVHKSFVQAAESIIAKGTLSMANVRDIVLAVGPDGVQDLYVILFYSPFLTSSPSSKDFSHVLLQDHCLAACQVA